MFYVSTAGTGKNDAMARQSYEMVSGRCAFNSTGDGIVPIQSAHLTGATQINIQNISHAMQLANMNNPWYGSKLVVDEWFGEVLNQLTYIQGGDQALREAPGDDAIARVDTVGNEEKTDFEGICEETSNGVREKNYIEGYFRRRNALRYSGIFNTIPNKKAYERLVYSMERITLAKDTKFITQGDKSDSIFFVREGQVECYDEKTGEVKATLGKNAVIGELGTLLGERRALSVRVASQEAALYRLLSEDINQCTTTEQCIEEGSSLKEKQGYEGYFEEREKRQALKACPLFKELEEDDVIRLLKSMQRKEIPAGDRIIEEGASGKSMYFVQDGSFVCYRECNKNVVKVCKRLDYFGELGVIFDRPRAVSVKASEPSVVYELEGDNFLECYRKMTAAKLGASAWLLPLAPLGKNIRSLVPRPVLSLVQKAKFSIGDLINRYTLTGQHFKTSPKKGTNTHLTNAFLSAAIPLYFRTFTSSVLSKTVMNLGFSGKTISRRVIVS